MSSVELKFAFVMLSLSLATLPAETRANEVVPSHRQNDEFSIAQISGHMGRHLKTDDSIGHVLNHPAFAGFGRVMLPREDRTYDQSTRLSDLHSLLPYHTHVDPETVVGALNHMIDDVSNGRPVFYDFYTKAQKEEQSAKAHAGLFFFRGKPGAPFAVISPGGGFSYVASVHEGFPYAVEISNKGYNAFVLRYRVGLGGAIATQDLAAAISYIFANAKMFGVGTSDYSLMGQLGWRKDGGRHRLARCCELRWRRPSKAINRRDGLHRPFRLFVHGASDLCCGRRSGQHRTPLRYGKSGCGPAQSWDKGGVS